MTTDNPDPLEVWREACAEYHEAGDGEREECAAAIIAQHYAPVIAENERLENALTEVGLTINAVEQGRIGINTAFDQMTTEIAKALGAKP